MLLPLAREMTMALFVTLGHAAARRKCGLRKFQACREATRGFEESGIPSLAC